MAVSNYRVLQAFRAGKDLSKAHGIFVKLDANGRMVKTQAATDAVIGVVVIPHPWTGVPSDDDANVPGTCCEVGVKVPAVTSAAIAVGDTVKLATNGKIATSGGSGPYVGVALEAATAGDQVITILYTGMVPRA